jgi:hypothetical protein
MSIRNPPPDHAQSALPTDRDNAAATLPSTPLAPPLRPRKSAEIGCVFAGLEVRVVDRSPDDYAAFLDEL